MQALQVVRRTAGHLSLALFCTSLGVGAVAAQTIAVQSGEHQGFTRLVLDIGATRNWQLEGGDRQYRLVLDPPAAAFAIGRVFDLIPRSRLADLSIDDGLVLALACDCEIDASRYQQRYLLLDIRPAATGSPPETILPDTARLLLPSSALDMDGFVPNVAARPEQAPIDLQEAGRLMAAQLARAAAAGLLQASEGRPMTDADPIAETRDGAAIDVPTSTIAENLGDPPLTTPPIRAETAFDRVMPTAISIAGPGDGSGCTGAPLDMREWSAGAVVFTGLGPLRAALFDERDQLQPTAVLALARHYLSFGFGAEAAFWLDQIDTPPRILHALAALVDDLPGPHFPPMPDALACGDEELLWRYLDGAFDPALLTGEEAGRLQRATASLPDALRDQIAPRIARALHRDGFDSAARNLRDMLWRGGRLSTGALLRLDRDLGIQNADPQATREALAMALRDAGGEGVAALAHAMAFDREAGMLQSVQHIAAAEAMLRESGIGPVTIPLWHELVLAHAATGDLDRMLVLLGAPQVASQDRDATLTALFGARLAVGDTPALFLLARTFGPVWHAEGSTAGRARVATIAHLRDLGLTGAAEALNAGQRMLILPADPLDTAPADALRMAWQEANWSRIAEEAAAPHREVAARVLNGQIENAPLDAALLASDLPRLSSQLADSRALRAAVGALLAAPSPIAAEGVE
ncbi:hypothetical protein [Roseicyclus sp.]|uniref:hypothetical protein n=1 Tax=Roseicyclus sp. TaxID=1914329 RepID=UPI003F6A8B51